MDLQVAFKGEDATEHAQGGATLRVDTVSIIIDLLQLILALYGILEDCGGLVESGGISKKFLALDSLVEYTGKYFDAEEQDHLLHVLPARDRIRFIAMVSTVDLVITCWYCR